MLGSARLRPLALPLHAAAYALRRPKCLVCDGTTQFRTGYGRPFAQCVVCDLVTALDADQRSTRRGMGLVGSWSGPQGGGGREEHLVRLLQRAIGSQSFLLYGTGNTPTLDRLLADGIAAYGADVDNEVVALKQAQHGLERFFHVDRLPRHLKFDAIVAVEVFEHFTQPTSSLGAIFELLAPHGVVCGTTDFFNGTEIEDGNDPGYMRLRSHVAYWSKRSLVVASRRHGYETAFSKLTDPTGRSSSKWKNKHAFFLVPPTKVHAFSNLHELELTQP